MRNRSKPNALSDLLPKVLQQQCFEQRSHLSSLAEKWREIFQTEFGTLVERNGDVLIIQVEGAPKRSECETFHKHNLLEILHLHEEFSSIRDLKFKE